MRWDIFAACERGRKGGKRGVRWGKYEHSHGVPFSFHRFDKMLFTDCIPWWGKQVNKWFNSSSHGFGKSQYHSYQYYSRALTKMDRF
mmetsp:Transcript_17671/g.20361  ORF Transcript_17671/g.20361 Transcript_17671/m.20361 type:complete len:87 (-) Transcript_17671:57-317(-)